jgi:signal transduction histidine kinase
VGEADELRASRARLAEAAASARRGHERALHDGVQQDLIALAVRLQIVRDLVADDAAAALALLEELQQEVHDSLDRVRGVAEDIYPSLLELRGLPDTLRHEAHGAGVTAHVEAHGVGRYAEAVEAGAYFCCRALLTSIPPGGEATIALRDDDGSLRIEVAGVEANELARDLAEAAGGELSVERERITATFPRGTGSPL